MLDTLALTLMLLSTPVPRPNMERVSVIKAGVPAAQTWIKTIAYPEGADAGNSLATSLATCYENKAGSCWTEE